jgi:2-C-methyl-D-erythritol 4-phosphate cytidylyltransferase
MAAKRYALIVAGGSGVRMGADIPKQFLEIAGLPILMHTIEKFRGLTICPEIVLVLPQSQIEYWNELCQIHGFFVEHTIEHGGETRFHSVKNGLGLIRDTNSIVAIHDGVRPLVATDVIELCYQIAEQKGNAVPVVTPVESIRLKDGNVSYPYPRDKVLLVQTPQVFRNEVIKECYETPYQSLFTDDASVAEFNGISINLVEGNRENIKITTPIDLIFAEVLLSKREN